MGPRARGSASATLVKSKLNWVFNETVKHDAHARKKEFLERYIKSVNFPGRLGCRSIREIYDAFGRLVRYVTPLVDSREL